jgi:hypothetical protein
MPLPPIKDRRFVFTRRLAAGMSPRMASRGLALNGAREAKREDVQAAVAELRIEVTRKAAERLNRENHRQDALSRSLGAITAPPVREPSHGPSTDAPALSAPANACFDCGKALGVGEGARNGPLWLCADCHPGETPNNPLLMQKTAAEYSRIHREGMAANLMHSRLVNGCPDPPETGTWSLDRGFVRDPTEADRAELAAKVLEKRASTPRRAWLPGQKGEL